MRKNPLQKKVIQSIEWYQKYFSPDHSAWGKQRGPYCRFYPSCSEYAKEAIESKGVLRGGIKGMWRILRCMPWSKGGYDPVEKKEGTRK